MKQVIQWEPQFIWAGALIKTRGQGEVQTKNSFSLVVVELLDPGYVSMGSRIYFRPDSAGFKALDFITGSCQNALMERLN